MDQPQPLPTAQAQELNKYVNDLLNRERFRKSPSLRQLLEYLVRKAGERRIDEIKESTIAIDVFGRSLDFDGRLDNIVRVQAHRLRKLLESHYQAEGAGDRFHITIPKGTYVPSIVARDEGVPSSPPEPVIEDVPDPIAPVVEPVAVSISTPLVVTDPPSRRWRDLAVAFIAGTAVAALIVWAAPGIIGARQALAGSEDPRVGPLGALWGSLLQPNVNCVVSFTNPVFLWTRTARSRVYATYHGPLSAPVGTAVDPPYVDPELAKEGRTFFFSESWTGTGEVFGVHRLTKLFASAGHSLNIVRSRALTYADLRDANVVFLGSPWANELQDKIHPGQTPLVCLGTGKITNLQPRPGEEASYEPVYDPNTRALTATYALISVLPGATPGTKMISSAGIDTYGTSAGIDFLTSASGVSQLIERFDPTDKRKLPEYFQAVIHTEIIRGDPARWDLILVRQVDRTSLTSGNRPAVNP